MILDESGVERNLNTTFIFDKVCMDSQADIRNPLRCLLDSVKMMKDNLWL